MKVNKVSTWLRLALPVLALVLVARLAAAQEVQPESPATTAFTYQGRLADDQGVPIDKSCDFHFTLWDDPSAGNQVGSQLNPTGVAVTDGLFTVQLDFGSVFDGTALWLEVAVQCSGDAGYTTLAPRQSLTAAPYAVYALHAQYADNIPGHDHWGQTWTGAITETGLTLSGGTVGLSSSGATYGVYGTSDSSTGYGVKGSASSTDGATYGVYGESAANGGNGVYGRASATTGYTYGVYGQNYATGGGGVVGHASATTGSTYGVYGQSESSAGYGVYGLSNATDGYTYGVYGQSLSTQGRGVFGSASASTGSTYGVYGQSRSTDGRGVYGSASAGTGTAYGVYGQSSSTDGAGVYGLASSISGYNYGVYGRSDSTYGTGVYGWAANSTGLSYGVHGQSDSPGGRGVYGEATGNGGIGVLGAAAESGGTNYGVYGVSHSTAGTGVYGTAYAGGGNTYGVYGQSYSPNGYGGYFWSHASLGTSAGVYGRAESSTGFGAVGHNFASGVGVGAWSWDGNLIEAYAGDYPNGTRQFYVTNSGSVYANGTYNTFKAMNSSDGAEYRTLYGMASPEAWYEDFGTATLVDGRAVVTIDPLFAQAANVEQDYHVYLTPVCSDLILLSVTDKGPAGFQVQGATLEGKPASCSFDYRIVARQRGYEGQRLETVEIPEPVQVERAGEP